MKKLISIIFLFLAVSATAQVRLIKLQNGLDFPGQDTVSVTNEGGSLIYSSVDGLMYYYSLNLGKWIAIQEGSGGGTTDTTSLSNRIDINTQGLVDSSAAIRNEIKDLGSSDLVQTDFMRTYETGNGLLFFKKTATSPAILTIDGLGHSFAVRDLSDDPLLIVNSTSFDLRADNQDFNSSIGNYRIRNLPLSTGLDTVIGYNTNTHRIYKMPLPTANRDTLQTGVTSANCIDNYTGSTAGVVKKMFEFDNASIPTAKQLLEGTVTSFAHGISNPTFIWETAGVVSHVVLLTPHYFNLPYSNAGDEIHLDATDTDVNVNVNGSALFDISTVLLVTLTYTR